jgi:sugar O-acyltransferase (sialic acid O-acetyltransferase NeuD family)
MPTDLTLDILGAGGHAKVVIDALLSQGWPADRIRVRDDRIELQDTWLLGCRIFCPVLELGAPSERRIHAAVGSASLRQRWLQGSGLPISQWQSVIHAHACVATSAVVGPGSFVAARAVIGPDAKVGESCIVNHGAVVDHDCFVGAFCHVAPGAILGGAARIGNGVLIGSGAVVLPGIRIGAHAVVGAGAVVTRDVQAGVTVSGMPAMSRSENS